MTFLEKLKENNPTFTSDVGDYPNFCPSEVGLENGDCKGGRCLDCWNREMPNTETKEELFIDFKGELDTAYNKGLNDAWEFLKKIEPMSDEDYFRCFGKSVYEGVTELSPQEALAKLKAYEEAQKIEVGDVVDWLGVKAVVIDTIDEERIYLFDENGCVEEVQKYNCEKLGKQLDIKGFIEQIGE